MIRLLDPKDFELLIDLVFSTSGWRRQTRAGGTQKTVDLDLLLPSTEERAFVQIKAQTDTTRYLEHAEALASTDAHARMFYVWHTGHVQADSRPSITLWRPELVAQKVLDAGLVSWVKEHVS